MATTTLRKRRQLLAACVAALVALVVAALLAVNAHAREFAGSLFSGSSPAHERPIGEHVTVTGDDVSNSMAAERSDEPSPFSLLTDADPSAGQSAGPSADQAKIRPITDVLRLSPSGRLSGPTTFTFQLQQPLEPDVFVGAVTNPSWNYDQQAWQPVPPEMVTVSSDRLSVSVRTDHLSLFQLFQGPLGDMLDTLAHGLVDAAGNGAFSEAVRPACPDETKARTEGYGATPQYASANAAYWCFGYVDTPADQHDRQVTFVNNRRYAVEVTADGMVPIDSAQEQVSMVQLYKQQGHLVVMPRERVTFHVNPLAFGGQASLSAQLSSPALVLTVLDQVYDAVAALAIKNPKVRKMTDLALLAKGCFNNADLKEPSLTAIILNCFSAEQLAEVFGPTAWMLSPIIWTLAMSNQIRASFNALADRNKGWDKYRLNVSRTIPDKFTGTWQRFNGASSHTIEVKPDGTAHAVPMIVTTVSKPAPQKIGDFYFRVEITGDNQIRLTVTDVKLSPGVQPEFFPTVGQQFNYELDAQNRLRFMRELGGPESRDRGWMTEQQFRDSSYYCGARTLASVRSVCTTS